MMLREGRGLRSLVAVWLALSALGAAIAAAAEPAERPEIGLALSGGGARGAAHVGVLRVLEEMGVPIDYVAGTSMGAIIGGLYAAGLPLETLEEELVEQDWTDLLDDRTRYRDLTFRRKRDRQRYGTDLELGYRGGGLVAPAGLRSGQKLTFVLQRLLAPVSEIDDFGRLPIPFRAVAADIETGAAVLLTGGDLHEALRASMSIPGIFAPVELDGRLLVDGGIADNLPVDVVRAMGADVVIAVDVSEPLLPRDRLKSLVGITNQAVNLLTRKNMEPQLAAADLVITPALEGYGAAAFQRLEEIVAIGERAARERTAELAAYRSAEGAAERRPRSAPAELAGEVAFLRIVGAERVDERLIRRRLRLEPGETFDAERLREELARVYGMGDFQRASFERVEEEGEVGLELRLEEKPWGPSYVRFGLELLSDLEGDTTFSAVANLTRTHLNARGGEWRNDLRIGRRQSFVSELYQPFDFGGRFFHASRLEIDRALQGVFEDGDKIAEYENRALELGFDLGRRFGRDGELRVGLLGGRREAEVATGSADLPSFDVDVGGARAQLAIDRTDHPTLPRRGLRLRAALYLSRPALGADDRYDKLEGSLSYLASRGRHTWLVGFDGGGDLGSAIPTYDVFLIGGLLSLGGYGEGELRADAFALGRLGYRYRLSWLPAAFGRDLFAGAVLEAGQVAIGGESLELDDLRLGLTALVGADTLAGPLFFGYGVNEDGDGRFYLTLGRAF